MRDTHVRTSAMLAMLAAGAQAVFMVEADPSGLANENFSGTPTYSVTYPLGSKARLYSWQQCLRLDNSPIMYTFTTTRLEQMSTTGGPLPEKTSPTITEPLVSSGERRVFTTSTSQPSVRQM